MGKQIIVDIHFDQTRVAVMEDGELVEFYMEDDENYGLVGNIYRGRVVNVLPGMQAAFVDIGLERNAFLYVVDINTENSVFDYNDKDNKDQTNIKSLSINDIRGAGNNGSDSKRTDGNKRRPGNHQYYFTGRYVVLMPTLNYVGVSEESKRGRAPTPQTNCRSHKTEDIGLIVRTAARDKNEEDLIPDIEMLCRLWEKKRGRESRNCPRILHKMRACYIVQYAICLIWMWIS